MPNPLCRRNRTKRISRVAHLARDDRGTAVAEMAMTLVLLIILLAGAVDIGRAFQDYIVVINASREGARRAAQLPCNGSNQSALRSAIVQAAVGEAAGSNTTITAGDVTITPDPVGSGCPAAGATVEVAVSIDFSTALGGIIGLTEFPIGASTTMIYFGND